MTRKNKIQMDKKKWFRVLLALAVIIALLSWVITAIPALAEPVARIANTTTAVVQGIAAKVFNTSMGIALVLLGLAVAPSLAIVGTVLAVIGLAFIAWAWVPAIFGSQNKPD